MLVCVCIDICGCPFIAMQLKGVVHHDCCEGQFNARAPVFVCKDW